MVMKKFIGGLVTLILLFSTMAFSAMAADTIFEDTLEDNYRWCIKNPIKSFISITTTWKQAST